MISNGFMYWIFFALCKLLYGVIPGLYDAFEFFGTYQFFDLDNDIKTIWGNLYVLLSVLVLFAIAIKLINAIVNPDVFDDKKNGVKKVFIKAFVAVFLTVLTPYMFTLLVDVQENIFTNKTIDKIFFNASGNQNTGHVIAWTAITSFINLDELADVTATTNHAYILDTSAVSEGSTSNSHIYILSQDIEPGLNNIYRSQPWQYTDTVHQNPILMLLAGAFIVYEFILLVMDTALRSIKLGILQMMTPVILGAYIFKEDILKKWTLEYIKTFIQIFLLLISLSLMTKVLSLLPNIMAGPNWPNNPSWLLIGIINTLAIMATLRLVHQIIPLINKIFGTNIESKGGIRGRLGEMAAVGGLAQKAYDTFRTKAGNVGLKAAGAAAVIGTGPAGWLAAGGAAALHHQWTRGFGSTRAWKDTAGGKGIRAFGAGAKAVGVGLTSKGGIVAGVNAGIKSYNESPIGGIMANDTMNRDFDYAEKNSGIKNGIVSGVAAATTDADRAKAARAASLALGTTITQNLSRVGASSFKNKLDDFNTKSRSKYAADTFKSNYDGMIKKLDTAISNETDSGKRQQLEKIKNDILGGHQRMDTLQNTLNGVNSELAKSMSFEINKVRETAKSKVSYFIRDDKGNVIEKQTTLSELFGNGTDAGAGLSIGNFGTQIFSSFETAYTNSKNDIKDTMDKTKMTDRQKSMVNKTVSDIETINSTLATTQAKWNR